MNMLFIIRIRAGIKSQNLKLLSRGKIMSGAPIIRGTNQLPKKPIRIGITMKKIIIKACEVTIMLYNWSFPRRVPGRPSSIRIIILSPDPTIPDHIPNNR